jgi:hypothetical protein
VSSGGTVAIEWSPLAMEKSAEVVVPAGDRVVGREGPNAEPRRRTPVLVGIVMNAASPYGGLDGRV